MDWLALVGAPAAAILVLVALVVLLREKHDESTSELDVESDKGAAHLSRLLGYESVDPLGTLSLDGVHPDDRQRVGRIWAELVEQPESVMTFRYRERRADGLWRWVEATGANLRHEPTVAAVVINRRDITADVEAQRLLEVQVAERTRQLESLYRADETLRRSLRVEDVFRALADVASDIVGVDKSAVLARPPEGGHLTLGAARGFDTSHLPQITAELAEEIGGEVIGSAQPVVISDYLADTGHFRQLSALVADEDVRAVMCVPILVDGEVFAAFNVFYAQPHEFTDDEQRLLVALAQRAGLALDNARLYEAAHGKAALEERQRLARELHDSVSQAIYAIGLNTRAAQKLLSVDPARVSRLLGDVLALAETGLAELRALIFELRPESLETEGLVGALEKQAAAVQARHRLHVDALLGDEPDVPLATKEALYRLAQEALHNIAKHAGAQVVKLELESDAHELVLRIADDGKGFDASASFPGHLGLRSMRERTAAVGAHLAIDSALGAGTRICVRLPLDMPAVASAGWSRNGAVLNDVES
jgi:PAS domain S-box-containing protein